MVPPQTDPSKKRSDLGAAARIAGVYLVFAVAWILLSDQAVNLIIPPEELESRSWFQTVKGLTFVLVTAGLLMVLVIRRHSQIRRAEQLAADIRQRLLTFTNHFPGVVYIRDTQSRFVLLSGQLPQGGPPPEQLIGRTDEDQHTPETFQRLVKRDAEVIATAVPTQLLETIVVGGRTLHFLVHRFPLTSPTGEAWIGGLAIDITERQQAEDRIREMARELAQASRMKDQFLTNLSHELRTPVTAIRLWAEVLRNPSPDDMETIREAGMMIQHSAVTQTLLIEDLLDVSRIIGGKLRVELCPIRLDEVVSKTIELLIPMADEHQVTIQAHVAAECPCRMLGDARRVQQVVWNLLTNAIKFSEREATVSCRLTRDQDEWVIQVADQGRGISTQQLPHVFDRFREIESSRSSTEEGIGIGLSIVKHLVEAHGGSVRAESAGEGQGATFTVRFPALNDAGKDSDPPATPDSLPLAMPTPRDAPLADRRVLLVEDDADSRAAIAMIIRRAGATVTAVESAETALALEGAFDVLLSDISLPERDGCDLIAELRSRPEWKCLPAIACSAYALPEDRTRALESGFNDFVIKPVDAEELIRLLADRLADQPQ